MTGDVARADGVRPLLHHRAVGADEQRPERLVPGGARLAGEVDAPTEVSDVGRVHAPTVPVRWPRRSSGSGGVVERQVELEHVDAGVAEDAQRALGRVLGDRRAHVRPPSCPASAATRGACSWALRTEMCGSRPEPDAVTASTGTSASAPRPFSARYASTRSCDRREEVRVRRAEVRAARRGAVVAVTGRRRPRVEVLRRREVLADQRRADDDAVALDQRAVRLVVEHDLTDAGDEQRVHEAAQDGEDDDATAGPAAAGAAGRSSGDSEG